ncbi:GNAT family N-acetyltransferase [Blastococcus sp. CT_GayMR19]|uniref:GNAT family N-acetyltransferase n=1 Tax=Blastococcus sp. CT_GayMR19 TaxID=2559608 RepID=UPI00107404C5|nr:GNAT family N-acetyltransferase [Blastococcus sp. CT_GayMR19]TFV77451.1 GNAT family N-acetyltransferase [Blastococcus sp. CT_GayMR19]
MAETDLRTDRLTWVKDDDPRWDADRERVFATVPDGVFRAESRTPGERLSSDWWRVEDGGRVVGYGWLDDVWGDAEILLAVEEGSRGTGAGAFTLAHLEEEATARGLNYVVNVVRDTHPDRAAVTDWFVAHGFTGTEDGRLRKRVGDRTRDIGQHQDGRPGTGRYVPDEAQRAAYDAERERAAARPRPEYEQPTGADLGPGAEESGGYVDQEQHRF